MQVIFDDAPVDYTLHKLTLSINNKETKDVLIDPCLGFALYSTYARYRGCRSNAYSAMLF